MNKMQIEWIKDGYDMDANWWVKSVKYDYGKQDIIIEEDIEYTYENLIK